MKENNKITIIYAGSFQLPDKDAAAHRVINNSKILRELGYNVVFIHVDESLSSKTDILETKSVLNGFDVWSVPYPKSINDWTKNLMGIKNIKKIIKQYENVCALILYNYYAIAMYRVFLFAKKLNIKVLADITEWYSTKGTNVKFKLIKDADTCLRMRLIHKKLDGLIVISKYLENYYSNCKNVVRIPPLVDLNEDKWKVPVEPRSDNKIHLVYSGSPGKNKDKINIIVETLHKLKDFDNYVFEVVGISKEQYESDYPEHKTILSELNQRVVFLGRVTHTESIKRLKQADFSIFIREDSLLTRAGFPTKFAESISCGTPVITTKTSNLEDYLVENKNGFFIDINDEEKLLRDMEKILKMKEIEADIMKKDLHNKDIFNYNNYLHEIETLFKKTLTIF